MEAKALDAQGAQAGKALLQLGVGEAILGTPGLPMMAPLILKSPPGL